MDNSRFSSLAPIHIATPCSENWSQMQGDDQSRFCEKCVHQVRNSESMTATELDQAASSTQRVCLRLTVHPAKGVLSKDGWLPRLVTAGIAAAVISGCSSEIVGETAATSNVNPSSAVSQVDSSEVLVGKVALPNEHMMGTPAPKLGWDSFRCLGILDPAGYDSDNRITSGIHHPQVCARTA